MERSLQYNGYETVAKPLLLDAPRRWSVDIDIVRQEAGKVHVKHFSAEETLHIEEEAIASSLAFGHKIIDGKQPGIPRSQLP